MMLVSKILVSIIFLLAVSITQAHAATINISIPQGAATPGCEATNSCYIPASTSISINDEVVWTNNDSASHTVSSGNPADGPDGAFDSNLFMAGQTFSQIFGQAGEFPYFCLVHPWMIGEVIVTSPTPNISFSNIRAVDEFGSPIATIKVSQQIQFVADVKNNNNFDQTFAFVIAAKDAAGVTVAGPVWVTGSLSPQQSFSPALSMTFASSGTYQISAYLYDKMNNPTVLATPLTTSVTVNDQASPLLTQTVVVDTDESEYVSGDTLTVFGTVSPLSTKLPILIQVFSPTQTIVYVDQVDVSTGGEYLLEIVTGGPLWDKYEGTFTIRATYNAAVDQTTIKYIKAQDDVQPEILDTVPPETIKVSGPQETVESSATAFEFSSNEENVLFECSLDGSAFFACSSPYKSPDLVDGPHTLSIRAIDASNNEDNTPIVYSWIVDTSPEPIMRLDEPADNNMIFIIIGIAVMGGVGAVIALRRKKGDDGGSQTILQKSDDSDYSLEDSKLK